MSEENNTPNNSPNPFEEEETTQLENIEPKIQTKKVFRRDALPVAHINVGVEVPFLDVDPFQFKLRFKLSEEAELRAQEYNSLSIADRVKGAPERSLDEICDLLVELPTGFADLKETGKGPGHSFRNYVETCADPDVKDILMRIVDGASTVYWSQVLPRPFSPKV